MTLDDLRHFAVTNTLFTPRPLRAALRELAFVQADPIRAPARAQDLTLRHRVKGYRSGDLERGYEKLGVEEDFFINYGFVARELRSLMHPRPNVTVAAAGSHAWSPATRRRAKSILEFVRERGDVHPREVDARFAHGTVINYWGGSSNATTQLLDAMHYRGLIRVARREAGIRIYAAHDFVAERIGAREIASRIDRLVDAVVRLYAPLPAVSLSYFVRRLRFGVPQWRGEMANALKRAKDRLAHESIAAIEWYWPDATSSVAEADENVRLLTPFDPVVQDRARFEILWGWAYRFEAYTPKPKRKLGYYALPLLWRDRVIGWGNVSVTNGTLDADIGYVKGRAPRERAFKIALEAELGRLEEFLRP